MKWSAREIIAACILFGFVAFQMAITFSNGQFYPFSAYRMFSKNWPEHVGMDKVTIEDGHRVYRPWDLLPIPFFQANQIAYVAFLDPSTPEMKNAVCRALQKSVQSELKVFGQLIEFHRSADGLVQQVKDRSQKWTCI